MQFRRPTLPAPSNVQQHATYEPGEGPHLLHPQHTAATPREGGAFTGKPRGMTGQVSVS